MHTTPQSVTYLNSTILRMDTTPQYDKTVAMVTHIKGTPRIILLYSLIAQSFLHGTAFLAL
jgi:hypothetical protein